MPLTPIAQTSKIEPDSSLPFLSRQEEEESFAYPQSEAGKRVTLQEYWDNYYLHEHFAYEWNNGILEEKPMTDYDSVELYRWFLDLLQEYLRSNPIAALTMLELGVKMDKSVRKPDTGVVLKTNPHPFQSGDNKYEGVCDLCIESLSTSSSAGIKRDTVVKKREYAKNGVTEYFILDYRHKETYFYRLNPATKRYKKIPLKNRDIIESEVLPGFRFRLSDMKKMTSREALLEDPVYRSYVNPEYQAKEEERKKEKQRADRAILRAEQERKAKEEANQQAERETQRAEREALRAEREALRAEREALRAERERKAKEEANRQAELETQRAERETQRAEQAEEKAEKLRNFLKSQGLNPDDLL